MVAAPGIAGSESPEQEGCFLCHDESGAEWFIDMNNTGGPVDVWAVDGVDPSELRESPEGYFYVPRRIASADLELVRRDIRPRLRRAYVEQAETSGTETLDRDAGLYFDL